MCSGEGGLLGRADYDTALSIAAQPWPRGGGPSPTLTTSHCSTDLAKLSRGRVVNLPCISTLARVGESRGGLRTPRVRDPRRAGVRGRALTLAVPPLTKLRPQRPRAVLARRRAVSPPHRHGAVPNANHHAATDTPTTLDYHRLAWSPTRAWPAVPRARSRTAVSYT